MDPVSQPQWMGQVNDMKELLEQMMTNISSQSLRLDGLRLRLFLSWLITHSSKVKAALRMDTSTFRAAGAEEQFGSVLKAWLESLLVQGMLWEYRLTLDAIAKLRDFDPHHLFMIQKSEAGK